jgi:aspartate carbamoyltransferase catalytic subunit
MTLTAPFTLKGRSLCSIDDLTKEEILYLLDSANEPLNPSALQGKIIAHLFLEPSTRTRLSFEAATLRQGGQVISVAEPLQTSLSKGESLSDMIKMVSSYADLIVLRHPQDGAARWAAEMADVPIINAGDGAHEHPTQALLDLFAIRQSQGRLEGLSIALGGDLKYGRTIHSLLKALAHFKPRLFFICPEGLEPSSETLERLKQKRILFSFHPRLSDVLPSVDLLYMTRIQKERLKGGLFEPICLDRSLLNSVQDHFKILHPLPRNEEIAPDCDNTPHAFYFEQAKGGLNVRAKLLSELL